MTQDWVTFDCYGTLVDWNRGIGDALRRLWPNENVARLVARFHAVEPLVQEGRSLPYRDVLARCLRAIAAIEGFPLAPHDDHALGDALPSWTVFPEVNASLRSLLDDGWNLGILSNTDPDLLAASLLHLDVPIDITITAADAGSYKPAHGHWRCFYERIGAVPAHQVHVGASLFHDIVPASELGIPAVWINRLNERSDLPRAAELPTLDQLAEILQGIRRAGSAYRQSPKK